MQTYSNYRISLKKSFSKEILTDLSQLKNAAKKIKYLKTHQSTQQKQKENDHKKSYVQIETKTQKLLPKIKRMSKQTKTFFFQSSDNYIKKILSQNQWTQSILDNNFNNLKWITLTKPEDFHSLERNQLINHFKDSYKLTTKLGLFNLLSSPHNDTLTDQDGKNYMSYFPRSYDLGADFNSFKQDFEHTAILNLMKKIMIHIEILYENSLFLKYKNIAEINSEKNEWVLCQNLQEALQKPIQFFQHKLQSKRIKINGKLFVSLIRYFFYFLKGDIQSFPVKEIQFLVQHSKQIPPFQKIQNPLYLSHYGAILLFRIYSYCLSRFQYFLNDGLNNIWVVKLNESSRGRSIKLIDDLEAARMFQKDGNKLIQKYIQNVWILKNEQLSEQIQNKKIKKIIGRKFDIRFWVLVKSFLPLQAYIYEDGYLRLSSKNYKIDENSKSLQRDIKTHLTNYSINYGKSNEKQNLNSEHNDQDSYLLFSDFLSFVQRENSNNSESELFKKIVKKIHHVLNMASNGWRFTQTDKNSFQLFGFDVILDSQLEPFILECNMSPACHQRGQLKDIVHKMGKGLLQIIGVINEKNQKSQQNQKQKSGWIKITKQKVEKTNIKLQNSLKCNFEQNFINGKNSRDLFILGQIKDNQKLLKQDYFISFTQKLIYLQRFFKHRYSNKKYKKIQNNLSKCCLLIQKLGKILKRNRKIWVKKFLKYNKKSIKRIQNNKSK